MVDMDEKREKTWQLTKKAYPITVRVTAPIYDVMLGFLETGAYLNLSEYVNELFQQYFKEKGIEIEAVKAGEEEEEVPREENLLGTSIVNARLPIPMKNAVDQVLDSGLYFNISHYLRDIIRKDLEARGINLEKSS
ncbi:unnamed protein product [marine sediment metagenome]|uniref:Uncharacterized protein n=1 Tax=marine sediment metagenome TaxID=412755 RepID=X1HUJ9_9ZZZZ